MAHHMVGKFTIHDIRPHAEKLKSALPYACPCDGVLNHAQAFTAAEELAEKGFRPRVDFAVIEWMENVGKDGSWEVIPLSGSEIHHRADVLWLDWKAKQPKPKKIVVELWAGSVSAGYQRFGWLIEVDGGETRIAFTRDEATEFESVTPEEVDEWHKALGSPPHIELVPREIG